MRSMHMPAEAPLSIAIGGPNEGSSDFADGLSATPPLETHKDDLSVPEGYVSRMNSWRLLSRGRVARVATLLVLAAPASLALSACGPGGKAQETSPGAAPGGEHTSSGDPCHNEFGKLDAKAQEECRSLIATMPMGDVVKLGGLDEARWASYYRHEVVGEKPVLHNVVRSGMLDGDGSDIAAQLMADYQASIYSMAWLMQNKPEVAQDPRTALALLGTIDKTSSPYALATFMAEHRQSDGQELAAYAADPNSTPLFSSFTPENIIVTKQDNGKYEVAFTAEPFAPDGAHKKMTYDFVFYPYLDVQHGDNGEAHEAPDDPNAPDAAIFTKLGTPLLAAPPILKENAA